MLKWTYTTLGVLFYLAILAPVFLIAAFVIGGSLAGSPGAVGACLLTAIYLTIVLVQVVSTDATGMPALRWWFPNYYAQAANWPVGIKLLLLLLLYAFVGWLAFQAIVSPNDFRLPELPFDLPA
jgi:hypothetical protein